MRTTLPIDELNKLESYLTAEWEGESRPKADDVIDEVLDILILAYLYGNNSSNEQLFGNKEADSKRMYEVIYKKVADKDFEERVSEYVSSGTVNDILLVAETEAQRVFNQSALDTAISLGATNKQWVTMKDERVRDTHSPLEGMTIPINDVFVTWDGDSALCPGLFSSASNNCNCRCFLKFS